ncbi:MAG: TolC family protein [Epsilonproteobacteria bacterium]|nr:TolC family protein [Campylobacterota bacterium]
MNRALLLFLPLVLVAGEPWLSTLKRQELNLTRQKAIEEAKKLQFSWINPIKMSYLYQKGDQFPNQRLENFTISVDQPIFKSGGIYKAITYALAKKRESLLGVKLTKKELIAQVLELLYNYKKSLYQIQKQKFLIQNAKLDVLIKKEQYLSNEIDSTFLDNAILQKNQKELTLLTLKQNLSDIEERLAALSDIDPDNITLPRFKLIRKDRYLDENLALRKSRQTIDAAKDFYYMTIARYLPQISLQASYNYQKMQGSLFVPDYSYADHYSTYGVRFSMPLFDINSFHNIEIAKLDLLKSKNSLSQLRREKEKLFDNIAKQLTIVQKKIALSKEDKKLYQKLYDDTKERVKAGEKTEYDEEIMANSLRTKELDIRIYEIDRQLLLLKLYKELSDEAI